MLSVASFRALLLEGTRRTLAAPQAEVTAYVALFVDEVDEHGHRLVVRSGYREFGQFFGPALGRFLVNEGPLERPHHQPCPEPALSRWDRAPVSHGANSNLSAAL